MGTKAIKDYVKDLASENPTIDKLYQSVREGRIQLEDAISNENIEGSVRSEKEIRDLLVQTYESIMEMGDEPKELDAIFKNISNFPKGQDRQIAKKTIARTLRWVLKEIG
jgi:hypothetical protein